MKGRFFIIAAFVLSVTAIVLFISGISSNRREPVVNETHTVQINTTDQFNKESTDSPENLSLELPLEDPKIVVWKSERRLDLYSGDDIQRSYRIGLGFSPEGDKRTEGDGCTPEGEFYICVKNPTSRFLLSLGISYPNEDNAVYGLREGLINDGQYQAIVDAIRNKRQPPWDTPLGGEVFIHGYGSGSDWTLGCIALDNPDVRELYDAVPIGTPVYINP